MVRSGFLVTIGVLGVAAGLRGGFVRMTGGWVRIAGVGAGVGAGVIMTGGRVAGGGGGPTSERC